MSEQTKAGIGSITWRDLTVADAEGVRDFYCAVVGWEFESHQMEGYDDYCMQPPGSGETVAGICHARGSNANIPPAWLMYITVEDVDASAAIVRDKGGEVLDGPRDMGGARFCVIKDPGGAVCALFSQSNGDAD